MLISGFFSFLKMACFSAGILATVAIALWCQVHLAADFPYSKDLPLPPEQFTSGSFLEFDSAKVKKEFPGFPLPRHRSFAVYQNGLGSVLNAALNSARSGNAEAEYVMGWMWANGYGSDVVAAKEFRRLSGASAGQLIAATSAYVRIASSDEENGEAAFRFARNWYKLAASHGCAKAAEELGFLSELGRGGPPDQQAALYWYGRAAAAGDDVAKMDLAFMHENGKGCNVDYSEAMRWYERAYQYSATSEWALANILRLWATNRAYPSASCRKGARNLKEFLAQIHFYDDDGKVKTRVYAPEYLISAVLAGRCLDETKEVDLLKHQHKIDFERYLEKVESLVQESW